jgi:rRNA processing protein Gar1
LNWYKVRLIHVGISNKDHSIFRAINWDQDLEKIIKKPLFTQEYKKIGTIIDVFGPIDSPFISVKPTEQQELSPDNKYYVKGN